ncbi:MAG: hypothetical protein PHO75_00860 [Candidatus Shapirobacteria bacterium]|jgi:hypothetical protein|nr:hypothetical protein [Candidatus Shapirobacteria bacterium]
MSEKNDFEQIVFENINVEDIVRRGKIRTCIEESNHQKFIDNKKRRVIDFVQAKKKIELNKQSKNI